MIRSTIDSAHLPIQNGTLAPISASQARLGLVTELKTPKGISVNLAAFKLELYNPNSTSTFNSSSNSTFEPPTILTLSVPEHTFKGRSALAIPPQNVTIANTTELSKFLTHAFSAHDKATIGVRAVTTAKIAASRYPVKLNKNVTFGGMRGLAGLHILSAAAIGSEEPDAINNPATTLQGSLILPNYSPLTIGLGDRVTYKVFSSVSNNSSNGDLQIGNATVPNLMLQPGNQTINFQSTANTTTIMSNLEMLLNGMDKQTGELGFSVVGDKAYVGEEHIPYLDGVMKNVKVHGGLPFCEALKLVDMMQVPLDMMDKIDVNKFMECVST